MNRHQVRLLILSEFDWIYIYSPNNDQKIVGFLVNSTEVGVSWFD